MSILLKYILRFIKGSMGRTFLLVLAIAISGAMVYSMLSVNTNLESVYRDKLTNLKGNADIEIVVNDNTDIKSIDPQYITHIKDDILYAQNIVNVTGIYEYDNNRRKLFNLTGISLEDYMEGYNTIFLEKGSFEKFEGNSIIISKVVAEKYSLQLNDKMTIYVGPNKEVLTVAAIVAPTGLFLDESVQLQAILPYDTLNEWMYLDGNPNKVYIQLKNSEERNQIIEKLKEFYPNYLIREAINLEEVEDKIYEVSIPLIFSSLMGSLMCFFIIYSSFRVVLLEQLPHIGTFRSVGADKRKIKLIMFLESIFYGVFGGTLGGILGVGISYVITSLSIPEELKGITEVGINVNMIYFIICLFFSILISMLGTLVPIYQISKISVKNIVLNLIDTEEKTNFKGSIIYIPMLVFAFLAPYITTKKLLGVGAVAGIVLGLIALIKLLPIFLNIIARIMQHPLKLIFGNSGYIASANVSSNSTFANSSKLLVIGISIILMMNVISKGMTDILVNNVIDIENYDLSVGAPEIEGSKIKLINDLDSVQETYLMYSLENVEIPEMDSVISLVDGVSDENYLNFRNIEIDDLGLMKELQEGKNIILTNVLEKRHGLEIGDHITLSFDNNDVEYKIIGFADSYMTAGSFGLVSIKSLQEDTNKKIHNSILIKTTAEVSVESVADHMAVLFENDFAVVQVVDDFIDFFRNTMNQITFMIKALSVLGIIIGLVGIINNQLLTYIKRKRTTAIFRSVGMSRIQLIKMLFAESITVGIVGGSGGVIGGYLFISIVPMFFEMGNLAVPLELGLKESLLYTISAILVTVCSNILIAIKTYKFDIVAAIKTE
ncbi:FtsX-like permease family protein [Alkaliphilus transvaalensis]|uniref:FtsX-like permease family protein n=1 Tax=Alkaliphilus transvaalensis TaxID=114628 RepID=UPI00047DC53F|nr:FtsX-like permease family protein [Alkaliphilus transvaalensis]